MNMTGYLDWRFRGTSWLTLLVALICVVVIDFLPESCGYKNSPIENIQMVVVAVGLFFSCTAKDRKTLYTFVSLLLFFVLAREVNYGRTLIIFADPENVNSYPKWKDMEYGWLAHVFVGIYLLWVAIYFIWRKVWREIGAVLRETRIPVVDVLLTVAGMLMGVTFESCHLNLPEELAEVVFYVGGVGTLYLYTRNKVSKVE